MKTRSLLLPASGLLLAGFLYGCNAPSQRNAATAPAFHEIIIDGDTSEWPGDTAAYSDEHYLYLRFSVQGEQETLQSSSRTVTLLVDADADKSTGYVSDLAPMNELGVDLEVQFSPPGPTGTPLKGVRISSVDAAGNRTTIPTQNFDFLCAPTYASSWYEARISRTPESKGSLPESGLLGPGKVTCMATFADAAGNIFAFSDPTSISTDPVCPGGKREVNFAPPPKPVGGVRIVSWNIEKSAPVDKPEAFARVLTYLAPDVVLFQEWEKGDDAAMKAWLDKYLGATPPWNVRKAKGDMTNGGGVAIASRFPLEAVLGDSLFATYKEDDGKEQRRPVRYIGALATTPMGPMLLGSVHLKSGGSKDTIEDRRRIAEARAINATFLAVARATNAQYRLISGDLNLVGTRPALDVLRAGLDTDASDLTPAPTEVFGDSSYFTWRDETNPFGPGRLDWMVYSDASAKVASSFVLDVSRFTDTELTKMGIQREDAKASDHLPVVTDLLPAK